MKRIATKAGALSGAALVLLTMFAGVPVYAASWFDQWMETSADLLWNTIDSAYNYIDSTLGIIWGRDDVEVTPGTSGHDVLTQPRNYYSNDTIQQYNQTTNNYTNIDKRTVNVYDSKTTNYNSTVYAYDAGDTYYINVDNSQTVNNHYEITNIYYNYQYNTYNIYTTNSTNYYVTYAPTYTIVTYLEPGKGEAVSNVYFFQLPDGRASWDLTRDEAFGMYYIYNATNYETVVEDAKTRGLFHLDGSMADESTYNATATYTKGGGHNYVEHNGFDRALYWGPDSEQSLQFKTGGSGTLEFMLYTGAPTVLPEVARATSQTTVYGTKDDPYGMIPYDRYKDDLPTITSYFGAGYSSYNYTSTGNIYTSREDYFRQYHSTATYNVQKQIGTLVSAGGYACIPLYLYGDIQIVTENKIWSEYQEAVTEGGKVISAPYWWERKKEINRVANAVRGEIGIKVSANNAQGWEFRKLPAGSWNYIAISAGTVYVNGVKWDVIGASGAGSTFSIEKPREWNNFWYLDEVRVSTGTLYTSTYTPQGHPFDTNKVMVLPDSGQHGDIAVKSNIPVTSMRVGGARPTYPAVGDVYISVEKTTDKGVAKHLVKSVQQYQTGGWQPVDASIYVHSEWVHLKDYDLKAFTLDELPTPDDATLQKFVGATVRFKGPADAIQKIVVHGNTYQVGSGPRGPGNPYSVYGIENPSIKVNGSATTLPTNGELFTGDTRSSEGAENHGMAVRAFDGTENFQIWGNQNDTKEYASDALGVPSLPNGDTIPTAVSSHFAAPVTPNQLWTMETPGFSASYRFLFRTQHQSVTEFKSWLAAQHGTGKPVRVVYALDSPAAYEHAPVKFTNEAGEVVVEGPPGMEVWAYAYSGGGEDVNPDPGPGDWVGWWDKIKDAIKDIVGGGDDDGSTPGGDDGEDNWLDKLLDLLGKLLGGAAKILGMLVDGLITIVGLLFDGLGELLGFTERFGAFIGAAFTFIPPEIITVLVVGLALAVILMIVNFFR